MTTTADELNRQLAAHASHVQPPQGPVKRRTWEGYAEDYRVLSERFVQLTDKQEELLSAQADLQEQLAAKDREIARLNARRTKDLERLGEISRERDLLEQRTTVQMAKVAAAAGRTRPVKSSASEATATVPAGSGTRSPTSLTAGQSLSTGSWWSRQTGRRWWRQAVRQAQAAHREGRLADAQVLFEAALTYNATTSLWRQLGHVLREQHLFADGEAAYERALQDQPTDAETLFLAGYCAEMTGNKEKAAERYQAALASDPQLVNRYDHLRDFQTRLFG